MSDEAVRADVSVLAGVFLDGDFSEAVFIFILDVLLRESDDNLPIGLPDAMALTSC
jgi:hypothetical protein